MAEPLRNESERVGARKATEVILARVQEKYRRISVCADNGNAVPGVDDYLQALADVATDLALDLENGTSGQD